MSRATALLVGIENFEQRLCQNQRPGTPASNPLSLNDFKHNRRFNPASNRIYAQSVVDISTTSRPTVMRNQGEYKFAVGHYYSEALRKRRGFSN